MNPLKFIDKIKEMYNDQDPRYAKAEFSPVFDPDLEQSEFLRPGETLEDWKPNPFLKPHADGGRIGYDDGLLVGKPGGLVEPGVKYYAKKIKEWGRIDYDILEKTASGNSSNILFC